MGLPFKFDFKNPDYIQVFEYREKKLKRLRAEIAKDPFFLAGIKDYYRTHTAQFITDWGMTFDPRNVSKGRPAVIPFILFERQEEWVEWFEGLWKAGKPGLTEKSRDMGISWLTVAVGTTHCLLNDDVNIGFGSRKEEYVDAIGKPGALFYKARQFIKNLPVEFRGGWDEKKHSSLMRISFPSTGSTMVGEIGDNMGRGDRTAYYNVDESAYILHPDLVDAALSQTTNFRHDLSTPHGMNNSFARKRHAGKISVFTFHWRQDPRKDEKWYKEQCDALDDPVVIAQELDLDYTASVEGVMIPAEWANACIDAHLVLGITITGDMWASLDVADEGKDKNCLVGGHGVMIDYVEEKSGKGSDIFETVQWAADTAEAFGYRYVIYDADGLGAGVRGDARVVNEKRVEAGWDKIEFLPFRGSGEVTDKDAEAYPAPDGAEREHSVGRTNADRFGNAKAQEWTNLAKRCRYTYRAVKLVQAGYPLPPNFDQSQMLSISSLATGHLKLVRELSQPTRLEKPDGKLFVNKQPDGMPSPNAGDACMMRFAKIKTRALGIFDVI